jgi:drug/metabolite transporter (DMT)-like permease
MVKAGSPRREQFIGITCILGTLVGWASILLFLKHLVPYLDGWTTNGWRYGLSALLWLPLLVSGVWKGTLPEGIWWRAVAPSVFNCLGQILYAQMPYYIGPALGGFLIRMALISSTLGAFALFVDERVLLRAGLFWAGLCALIAGSVGTVFLGQAPIQGATATGVILGATSGLLFGLYGVGVRYYMRGIPAMTSFSVISLYTAAGLVAIMMWRGQDAGLGAVRLSAFNGFMLVASAVIGIAICHVSYYAAIARLGVAVSTAVVQLSPFLCAIGAWALFGDTLTPAQWISGFLMIAGALALLRAEQRRRRPRHVPATTVLMDELSEATTSVQPDLLRK